MPYMVVDGFVVWVPSGAPTATITASNGAGTTTPVTILGYEAARQSRNRTHDLIGGGIAVVLTRPRPRAGDLSLLYPVEADAWACVALHAEETTFTLVESSRPGIGMTYALNGDVRVSLDDQTRNVWVVTVPFQEVEP